MSMSTKRLIVLTMLISTSLLIFSPFQALGYSADSKLNISRCEIKYQTLVYEGSVSDKSPITIMARNKENPLDIRYMRIITPDAEGSFRNNIKFYDEEISADLFEMEVLFQADEDVPVVSFELPYFNKTKKTESINEMIKSSKGILDFMTSDEDSIKIYKVIFRYTFSATALKYVLSSLASWVIDNLIFNLLDIFLVMFTISLRLLFSTVVARTISSVFNFTMNRKHVFKSDKDVKAAAVRYYILWFCQMAVSYLLVFLFTKMLMLGTTAVGITKIIVDVVLFVVSYNIQKRWVFK